jgi:hypothetical protein
VLLSLLVFEAIGVFVEVVQIILLGHLVDVLVYLIHDQWLKHPDRLLAYTCLF